MARANATHRDQHAHQKKKDRQRASVADRFVALDPQDDFKAACVQIVDEYFESEDVGELARSLTELGHAVWSYEFVKQAVVRALDKSNRERELLSYLFSSLYGSLLSASAVQNGFRILLHRVDDLALDQPQAPQLLGTFIARAIVDDLLPPGARARARGRRPPSAADRFVQIDCDGASSVCASQWRIECRQTLVFFFFFSTTTTTTTIGTSKSQHRQQSRSLARAVSLLDDGGSAAERLERCWDSGSRRRARRI